MSTFKQIIFFLLAIVTFAYTFFVVGRFMLFLSVPSRMPRGYAWLYNLLDNKSRLQTAFGPLVYNTLHIIGFIFQHSCMKSQIVKNFFAKLGLAAAERMIYSLTSSLCLHILLKNWMPAQSLVLWYVNVDESKVLWWTFVLIHVVAWTIVYGGSLIMDLPEIIGVKQAYYDMNDFPNPFAYKSRQLQDLFSHIRHPSFIGLNAVLWATNLMSLDRLLLASLLSVYMYVAWSTDAKDVAYQKEQLQRKREELRSR